MVKNDLVLASSAALEMLKIPVEEMGISDIDCDHLLCSLFVSQVSLEIIIILFYIYIYILNIK